MKYVITTVVTLVGLSIVVRVVKAYKPTWTTTLQGWLGF